MNQDIKAPEGTKETLLKKAGDVFENVKEKVEEKTEGLLEKAKESELAGKAKEKLEDLKEGAKGLFNKVTDKFQGKI
ncbi:MAG: hypothetical protein KTQ13_00885 [Ferruginibacter sp.]|nr:hypothetical protein [Ferruginibacter sp.]MBU9935177.1 hypothetical protein [Ferruginibacter sp.]HQY12889.1 hypothetical protein [Ferruginibacter sp.]